MSIFRNSLFRCKTAYPLILKFSERIKCTGVFSRTDCIICIKSFTTSVPNLIKYHPDDEWSDQTFSTRLVQSLKEPKVILRGLYNFFGEFGKLYEENKESLFQNKRCQIPDPDSPIDMLFSFDGEEDLQKFMVTADSAQYGGYSSACLKMTPAKTAVFSGNICCDLVKDGQSKAAGYATMLTRKALRSFKRLKYFDWSFYTHLVFKVRGDGRTYYVSFSVKEDFKDDQSWVFSYPLFTRGGPYWQVSKIPLSSFFFVSKGKIADIQPEKVALKKIVNLGLTTRQIEGPFKLEIDYIGLEADIYHRQISPYEHYS